MHQREQERCVRKEHNAETLRLIAEEIRAARALVYAGWMATALKDSSAESDALGELFDTIGDRLAATADKAERASRPESSTDAA